MRRLRRSRTDADRGARAVDGPFPVLTAGLRGARRASLAARRPGFRAPGRLPPWWFDGEALVWPGMEYARRGEPVVSQFRHAIPCEAVLLAASPKRSTPEI